jgi:integrase
MACPTSEHRGLLQELPHLTAERNHLFFPVASILFDHQILFRRSFCSKAADKNRRIPLASMFVAGKEITMSETLPKLHSVASAADHLGVSLKTMWRLNLDGYAFTTKNGQPIDKHLNHVWRSALRKAGLRHRPSYQLRHTLASLCLQSGVAPGWLANVLGHSTLQTTFKHYARFIKDSSRENEARMEQLLTPKGSVLQTA